MRNSVSLKFLKNSDFCGNLNNVVYATTKFIAIQAFAKHLIQPISDFIN